MSDFSFERADGSKQSVSGYKAAKPPADSKKYANSRYDEADLPHKVDLRKYLTAVENQGGVSSCTANAVAGAYEYLAKMHTGQDYDVSRLFIYYNGRYLEEDANESTIKDDGSAIRKAIEGLKVYGACSETTYPYDPDRVNDVPEKQAYDEAEAFLVQDMALVPTDLAVWKHCLAEGYPIIFALKLYNSFDKQRKKGVVPVPSNSEAGRASHAGHAMLAVGYSDKDQVFIVRNSWGEDWGDNGYCYIPYDYMMNPELNYNDSWIIKQLDNIDFNTEEYWDEGDESVLGDYDSELANMTDDEYSEMLDAMGDYSMEYRIALYFLYAANADGDLTEEEYEAIGIYMQDVIDKLGVEISAKKVLRHAVKDVDNIALIQESSQLFSDYFSTEFLAKIVNDIQQVVGLEGLSKSETSAIYELMENWQVHEQDEESESVEEEEDEEEEEEDEEEEEEDEEEEEEDEEEEEEDEEEEEEDEEDADEEVEDEEEEDD